jgi:hypothetical protein
MTRRLILAMPFAARLVAADPAADAYQLVGSAVAYLSEGDARGFLSCFDPEMDGYDDLAARISGLLRACAVQSSVEVLRNEGDDSVRSLELDWLLQLKLHYETEQVERRREVVKCRVRKLGKKWKFVSLAPQSLFVPMKV